ncbi:hypothetical protein [Pseudomonas sp. LP_7_YM]|uniref:hypothetical protein n=1 Tax=Pseudomonas sp. LP_7_YM TaxID=2485137 RepID=UPI001414FE2F|nr:hypothetical protein [Pseudomonas sp. LP_7_YM]
MNAAKNCIHECTANLMTNPCSLFLFCPQGSPLQRALIGFIPLVCLSLTFATGWQMKQSRHERGASVKGTDSTTASAETGDC